MEKPAPCKTGSLLHEEKLYDLPCEKKHICVTSAVEGKFKFYNIRWIIRDFYIQSSQENWKACSPELAGPQETKLQLYLKPALDEDVEDMFSFTVKRLDFDLGPQTVWVNLRVKVYGPNEANKYIIRDKLVPLNKGKEIEIVFAAMDRFFDNIRSDFKSGTLAIKCKMIIYTEDEVEGFECKTTSLRSLSDDLLALYESSVLYDIELRIGSYMFPAHKAILCNHVVKIRELIDEVAKKKNATIADVKIFDLSHIILNSDYEATRRVLAFIYTGNLKHVLEKPSLSILEWALKCDIEEILDCYSSESLDFETPSNAEVYECNWPVDFHTIYEKKAISRSEILHSDNSSRTWQFQMYLKGNGDADCVAIVAETNEEIKSVKMCFEISIVKEDELLPVLRILRSNVDGCKKFEFDEFLYKNWMRSYETEGINLAIRIQLCSNETGSSGITSKSFIPVVASGIEIESYEILREKMRMLFRNTELCDCIIQSGDVSLHVHKFILALRCSVLYDKLSSVLHKGSTTKGLDENLDRISNGTVANDGSETRGELDKPSETFTPASLLMLNGVHFKGNLRTFLKHYFNEVRKEDLNAINDHSCIARGTVLYDKSERRVDLIEKPLILDVKDDILYIILWFIYTGEIDPVEDDKLVEVYKVAREFEFSLLEAACTKILLHRSKTNESLLYKCLIAAVDTKNSFLEAESIKCLQRFDGAC